MVCVFRAEGPMDAWLVRDHLMVSGIDAVVRDDLALARGEVPMDASWPSVWVPPSRAEQASAILAAWKAPYPVYPEQVCHSCGAASPPTFDWCWSCEQPF